MAFRLSATLVWRTEAKECGIQDSFQCGDICIGDENTCTCGDSKLYGENYDFGENYDYEENQENYDYGENYDNGENYEDEQVQYTLQTHQSPSYGVLSSFVCCPSSLGSCIKDQYGKDSLLKREIKISICFILLIFIGNVLCPNGTVKSLGEPCPAIGQCLTELSWQTKVLCEDRPSTCSEEKDTIKICRGIPGVACPKK